MYDRSGTQAQVYITDSGIGSESERDTMTDFLKDIPKRGSRAPDITYSGYFNYVKTIFSPPSPVFLINIPTCIYIIIKLR